MKLILYVLISLFSLNSFSGEFFIRFKRIFPAKKIFCKYEPYKYKQRAYFEMCGEHLICFPDMYNNNYILINPRTGESKEVEREWFLTH